MGKREMGLAVRAADTYATYLDEATESLEEIAKGNIAKRILDLSKGTEDMENDNQRTEHSKKMEHDGEQRFRD